MLKNATAGCAPRKREVARLEAERDEALRSLRGERFRIAVALGVRKEHTWVAERVVAAMTKRLREPVTEATLDQLTLDATPTPPPAEEDTAFQTVLRDALRKAEARAPKPPAANRLESQDSTYDCSVCGVVLGVTASPKPRALCSNCKLIVEEPPDQHTTYNTQHTTHNTQHTTHTSHTLNT